MKLKNYVEKINKSGRTVQGATRQEMVDMLDIIADDIMSGNTTIQHANVLVTIRHSMMTIPERMIDDIKNQLFLITTPTELISKSKE